ncbi:T9SS type A sorting domain-containing protein, partial [candidate division KSB1 bacterium]|nr:T9SS type A sorting domain-containing protein [candidate division KSB1 bacterium]
LMDDVRIYDLPLTEEEIIALTTIQPGFNTSVDKETDNIPATFDLSQNYPNPFNPTTTIDYALKTDGTVKLFVYDLTGKEVAVLVDGFQSAGNHKVQFDAANLTSGVYFYKMQAEGQIFTRKMTIIK